MKPYIPVTIRRDLILTVVILTLLIVTPTVADALTAPKQTEPVNPPPVIELAPDEAEQIEAALIASGYYRSDIPLSYELQDYLHTAAEEAGIPYELALGVIRQETNFRNVVGDDGDSAGYCQIQQKWHQARMDRLGVTDLMDPYSNFRVGCDFLGELIGRYGNWTDALTAYNSGSPGESGYAEKVIEYMGEYV